MSIPVRKSRKDQDKAHCNWRLRRGAGESGGEGEIEEVVSEAQRQLKELLGRQMDTSTFTLQRTLRAAESMFTAPVSYQPQDEGVAPLRSIHCYRSDQEALGRCNKLRGAGLSEREVELAVEGGANRGVGVEPSALQTQMATIQRKLLEHTARLEEAGRSSGVLEMSRHAWEVEQSLYRDSSGPSLQHLTTLSGPSLQHLTTLSGPSLQHLTTLNRTRSPRVAAAYPEQFSSFRILSLLPGTGGEGEEGRGTEKGGGDGGELEEVEKRSGGLGAEKGKGEGVPALPLQLIQRNRLSTEQIKQLPRFKDYSPGRPTSVLYIKNLHRKASLDDLCAIFGHWQAGTWPKLRLLTGRMGGQAFAHFQGVGAASEALEAVNGYLVQGKPLVISYGHYPTSHQSPCHNHNLHTAHSNS